MKKHNISGYEANQFKKYLLNGDGLMFENISEVKKELGTLLKYKFIYVKYFGNNSFVYATELGLDYFNRI